MSPAHVLFFHANAISILRLGLPPDRPVCLCMIVSTRSDEKTIKAGHSYGSVPGLYERAENHSFLKIRFIPGSEFCASKSFPSQTKFTVSLLRVRMIPFSSVIQV